MGLKMWSVVLVFALLILILVLFMAGMLSLLDVSLLVSSILIFFASYVTLTRRDPLTKVPTPLEIEKMKRRRKDKESSIMDGPDE